MAQQIAHWVRVGRELDSSVSLTVGRARRVSAAAYDQLEPEQQAVVRVLWDTEIDERAAALDLSTRFAGRDYVVKGDGSGRANKVAPPSARSAGQSPKKAPARKKTVARQQPAARTARTATKRG